MWRALTALHPQQQLALRKNCNHEVNISEHWRIQMFYISYSLLWYNFLHHFEFALAEAEKLWIDWTVHWFCSMNSSWEKYQNIFNTNTRLLNVGVHINTEKQAFSNCYILQSEKDLKGCFVEYGLLFSHQSNVFCIMWICHFFFLMKLVGVCYDF